QVGNAVTGRVHARPRAAGQLGAGAVQGDEADHRVALEETAVEHLDVRDVAGAGDDVGEAVAVDVGDADEDAALELGAARRRRIGQKARQQVAVVDVARPGEHLDVRHRALAGADDDVVDAVAVDVARRHACAAHEVAEGAAVADQLPRGAVEHLDAAVDALGAAVSVGADDDVGAAVAVDVAAGDVDAAGEARRHREEAHDLLAGAAVEDLDVPAGGARRRAGDYVGVAVAGDGGHRPGHRGEG